MTTWARIDGGIVMELSIKDPAGRYHPDMIWVDCTAYPDVEIGWTWDGAQFYPPVIPPPIPQTLVSPLDFINRFTSAEQNQIAQLVLADSQVLLWWSKLLASTSVDLLDPQTEADTTILVQANIITETRENEILTPQ